MRKLFFKLINCFFLFFIIVLIYHVYQHSQKIIYTAKIIVHDNPVFVGISFLLLAATVIFLKFLKINFKKLQIEKHYTAYSLIMLSMLLTIGIVSIIKTKIELDTDPKEYYQTAIEIINNTVHFDLYNIYHRRVLFYIIPIFKIFPESLLSVKIINLILVALTGIGYTFLVCKILGNKLSLLFSLLYLMYPTHYFVMNLVSHDLISNFYLMLFFINIYFINYYSSSQTKWGKIVTLTILAAILLVINELQRSTSMFLICAMFLSFIYSYAKNLVINNKIQWVSFIGIIVLFFVINSLTYKTLGVNNTQDNPVYSNAGRLYSYNNLNTDGTYFTGEEERLIFFPLIEKELWNKLAITKYFTQFVNYPGLHIKLILDKTSVLLNSSPYAHYFPLFTNYDFNPNIEIIYSFLRLIILLFAGVAYLKQQSNHRISEIIMFIIPLFLLFMMFSEVNTYYSFILIPLLLFMAVHGINSIKASIIFSKNALSNLLLTCILFLMIFSFLYVSSSLFIKNSSTNLVDFDKVNLKTKNLIISNDSKTKTDIYKIKSKFFLEPQDTSTIHISKIKEFKEAIFLLKTNLTIDQFELIVNGQGQKIKNYKRRSFKDYGYNTYAFILFKESQAKKNLVINFVKTENKIKNTEFEIRDLFLVE